MRIRVVVGRNTKTTRFVEGRVGNISIYSSLLWASLASA